MTLDALRQLLPGDRLMCRAVTPDGDKVAIGKVNAIDARCVEIWWRDGTSSLIWFRHAEDGRDTRHQILFPYQRVAA